jgi:hypothetical protein
MRAFGWTAPPRSGEPPALGGRHLRRAAPRGDILHPQCSTALVCPGNDGCYEIPVIALTLVVSGQEFHKLNIAKGGPPDILLASGGGRP